MNPPAQSSSLILTGPRCSGKTTIGQLIANEYALPFVDADKVFERKHGPIADYFPKNATPEVRAQKEYEFRAMETAEAQSIFLFYLARHSLPIVYAAGGGGPAHRFDDLRRRYTRTIREYGTVICLLPSNDIEESVRILAARSRGDQNKRPALTGAKNDEDEIRAVLGERLPRYRESAHHMVITGEKTPAEIADDIRPLITLRPSFL